MLEKIFGGSVLEAVSKLIAQFHLSPEEQSKMQQLVIANAQQVQQWAHETEVAAMANDIRVIEAVNATMRDESRSEHWLQYAWRPVVGFTFAAVLINNYVVLPYVAAARPIEIPPEAWLAMLTILGAASAFRGWTKKVEADKK